MYRPEVSKCHVALKQRKALNFCGHTHAYLAIKASISLRAMQQSYAAICLISTRKVPRHGLDFRVTAGLKSQCDGKDGGDWLGEETGEEQNEKQNDHTACSCERRPRCSNSQ